MTNFNNNAFPGYEYQYWNTNSMYLNETVKGDGKYHNVYRNTDVGKGGYVYAEPGMYGNVALLDVASMHPNSILAMNCFGDEYTIRFKEILDARIAIKHGDFDKARRMLDGKLVPYLHDESLADALAQALKISVNSIYGLTSAGFPNPFKDNRNKENIVALRGALFMRTLQDEVRDRGFTVCHIKTDSIKIADATPEIIQFVMEFGKKYSYTFEHEATYDRMCLVNDAVYIAKYKDSKECEDLYGYVPDKNKKKAGKWDATGAQFQHPYVFKTLFSREEITFDDLCETKSTRVGALYLDMNEQLEQSIIDNETEIKAIRRELNKTLKKDPGNVEKIADLENGIDSLEQQIEEAHNYIFVGRVGQFCPIKPGLKGGTLLYKNDAGKYLSVTGAKGYHWLESELVRNLGRRDDIDLSYYDTLVNDAAETISFYGDLEWFVSNDPYVGPPYDEYGKPVYHDSNWQTANHTY